MKSGNIVTYYEFRQRLEEQRSASIQSYKQIACTFLSTAPAQLITVLLPKPDRVARIYSVLSDFHDACSTVANASARGETLHSLDRQMDRLSHAAGALTPPQDARLQRLAALGTEKTHTVHLEDGQSKTISLRDAVAGNPYLDTVSRQNNPSQSGAHFSWHQSWRKYTSPSYKEAGTLLEKWRKETGTDYFTVLAEQQRLLAARQAHKGEVAPQIKRIANETLLVSEKRSRLSQAEQMISPLYRNSDVTTGLADTLDHALRGRGERAIIAQAKIFPGFSAVLNAHERILALEELAEHAAHVRDVLYLKKVLVTPPAASADETSASTSSAENERGMIPQGKQYANIGRLWQEAFGGQDWDCVLTRLDQAVQDFALASEDPKLGGVFRATVTSPSQANLALTQINAEMQQLFTQQLLDQLHDLQQRFNSLLTREQNAILRQPGRNPGYGRDRSIER